MKKNYAELIGTFVMIFCGCGVILLEAVFSGSMTKASMDPIRSLALV